MLHCPDNLFKIRSVAVVGASQNPDKVGYTISRTCSAFPWPGCHCGRWPLALLGNPGRRILGRGNAFQLRGFLCRDGRPSHLVCAGTRRDDGGGDLGRLRLEGVRRRRPGTKRLLALMFVFFIIGLVCVALAPVVK